MERTWTESTRVKRISPVDEILSNGPRQPDASRYGEDRRRQREREEVRESYLAVDVRLKSGEYRGLFYFDMAGSPRLNADHTILTVPFKESRLVVRGWRLLEVYRAVLHHSLDILEETHRAEFRADGEDPVIEAIEIIDRGEEQ